MRKGKVVNKGRKDEIINKEIIGEIYEMEIGVEIIGGKRIGVYYI